jgi:ABC-type lipoprotein export system ATPase subunit
MTAALEARHLTKRFTRAGRPVDALVDVDLSVGAGEVLVVAGPSLSGKTTLVHLLAGWMAPDEGEIRWMGRPEPPPWSLLTVVTQGATLLPELTVQENVDFASRIHGASPDGERLELLARLGLTSILERLPSEISVGERQRVMVARALVGRPAIVLADDPTAHQDDVHAEAVLRAIGDARDRGAGCIIAGRMDPRLASLGARELELD